MKLYGIKVLGKSGTVIVNSLLRMKSIKRLMFLLLYLVISIQGYTQSSGVVDYVETFLSTHDARLDTSKGIEGHYHLLSLQRINVKGSPIEIYKFGWNLSHGSTDYILVINQENWKVYGQNELSQDLVDLLVFFSKNSKVKKQVQLQCYEFLIGNYFQPYGKMIDIPLND